MTLSNLQVVKPGQSRTRQNRRPNFPIAGTMRPFGLYPLMIHPVLPGETLETIESKIRVLSRPVKHPLAGAWFESWFCYVKFTDLDRALGDMFVTDSYPTTGYTFGANNERYFGKTGQINWVQKCVERIHAAYFIHKNETARSIDGVPLVKLKQLSWMQNCIFTADIANPATGANVQGVDDQISAFEMMQMMQMSELTYEKYLEQYGVSSIRSGIGEPEILRYSRSWVQPVNTVEPTTGAPSSAWVWSDKIEGGKPKRFDEPGFIVQLACIRPKMFASKIASSMVGTLWGFSDWFPIYNIEDPSAGIKKLTAAEGVLTGQSADVFFDQRDLLAHGEQFVNTTTNPYSLPMASMPDAGVGKQPEDLRGEYAVTADVDALFTGATADTRLCYYEGITSLSVRGHIVDYTR